MFRAFIIDDDKSSTEVTEYMFPWEELCVSHLEKIYSPVGLVKRIINEKPDIVFIDIEFEDVSGLDIVEECIMRGSKALFIIISGHDNFKYAHQAVNIGVVHYLLKPLDPADVFTVTQKLKARLPIQSKEDISSYLADGAELAQYLTKHLDFRKTFRMIIANLSDQVLTDFRFLLEKCLVASFKVGLKKLLFIVDNSCFDSNLEFTLNNFAVSKRLLLCIGPEFTLNDNISDCFNRINTLSYQDFIENIYGLVFNKDVPVAPLKNILDSISKAIDTCQIANIIRYLEGLPALFCENHYTLEHVAALYNTIVTRISMNEFYKKTPFPYSQMGEDDIQAYFINFGQLCTFLTEYFRELLDNTDLSKNETIELWEKIRKYIEENYSKKIQMHDLCRYFFISVKTLHNVFKFNTGESFVEYLTRIRIEKSKQLLLTTTKQLAEIADEVGIKDYYYFNKTFKKQTGLTPLKFRKQNTEDLN